MVGLKQAVEDKLVPLLPQGQQPIYSFDNDSIHTAAVAQLRAAGILTDTNRAPLPARSPDMHKVVEHVMAHMARGMQELLTMAPEGADVEWYKEKLEEWFYEHISAESIAADVASLKETYQQVVKVLGSWPAKKYR